MSGGRPSKGTYAATFEAAVDALQAMRGPESLQQMQRIIDLAEAHDDSTAVIEWQLTLLEAASHYGRFDVKISAFQKLCSLYEAEPGAEDLRASVLWYWKWLLEDLAQYVEVPAEQIALLQQQMEDCYRREGESLSPVFTERYATAAFMGKAVEAAHWLERWEACDSGDSDDCTACQINTRVQALLDLERVDDAVDAAAPLIRGEQSCEQVPASTFSRLLLPLLFRDEAEMCISMMQTFRRQIRLTPGMFEYFADHLLFLSIVPSPQTARRHASIALRRLASCTNSYQRFNNARAGWVWASRRRSKGLSLSLPRRTLETLPCAPDDDSIIEWLETDVHRLAIAFDARNGTGRFQRLIESARELIDLETPDS